MVSKLIINNLFWWIICDKYFSGWKRELVYKTSGRSVVFNRANRSGDVYYYSPNHQKLRSLKEIQEYLNISSDGNWLTVDCFTFLTQPIGMNDQTKEVIIDAGFERFRVIKTKMHTN
jgi:hypothetical protein